MAGDLAPAAPGCSCGRCAAARAVSDAPLQDGAYTRGGLVVRRWSSLDGTGKVALRLPDGEAHLVVDEAIADEIVFQANPFSSLRGA